MFAATGCQNFDRDFQRLAALASVEVATPEALAALLTEIYATIFAVDFEHYDVEALAPVSETVLAQINGLRITLRDRIRQWSRAGLMTAEVQRRLRDVFRASRYATDMLGELMIGYDDLSPGEEEYPAFTGPHLNTLLHPSVAEAGSLEIRSGDVIVVRGTIHNSAAIARIGDVDSQFSHVGIVHIEPDGRKVLVEALIEDGATISDYDAAMTHALARAALYRHPDPELAAKAAKRIYDHVRRSQEAGGKHIDYDFSMELRGYDKLFCAKLVRQAYDEASDGLVRLPTFPTTFRTASDDFLERIGVTAEETFAPGDMELEADFQAVAEWRDYRRTSVVRLQDMVMVKLFEWMEQKDYRFRETVMIRLISVLGRASSHLPEAVKTALKSIFPKIPHNMRRETIAAIAMLHKTAQPLFEELLAMERATIAKSRRPLHPREIYAHLDKVEQNAQGRIGYLRQS